MTRAERRILSELPIDNETYVLPAELEALTRKEQDAIYEKAVAHALNITHESITGPERFYWLERFGDKTPLPRWAIAARYYR